MIHILRSRKFLSLQQGLLEICLRCRNFINHAIDRDMAFTILDSLELVASLYNFRTIGQVQKVEQKKSERSSTEQR